MELILALVAIAALGYFVLARARRPKVRATVTTKVEEAVRPRPRKTKVPQVLSSTNPPTERQLAFATDLGIEIPSGATKDDLSDLISVNQSGDNSSDAPLREFARRQGVECTEHIGQSALFARIWHRFSAAGREEDLAAWFVFQVLRSKRGGRVPGDVGDFSHKFIREIAQGLIQDEQCAKSVRRYEGDRLLHFGSYKDADGSEEIGASTGTYAYKFALNGLQERGLV